MFAAAREARARHSGDAVFLYGFIYFSTYCRNECAFCFYRAGNPESPRYRKSLDEVVAICRGLSDSGVVLLDLTMGEDPAVHDDPGYASLRELVGAVSQRFEAPGHGVARRAAGRGVLRASGPPAPTGTRCTRRRIRQELYARLRVGQPFAARAAARSAARRAGLLVEDGLLTGIGDTPADRAGPSSRCATPAGSRCGS